MASPEVRADVYRFMVGDDHRAPDRFRVLNLAWEYAADSFGSRQLLFDMHSESTLPLNRARLLSTYDAAPLVRLARSLAGVDEEV
jgi:aromatic ring hydroxylase